MSSATVVIKAAATPFSMISDVFYTLLERGLLLFALTGLSSTAEVRLRPIAHITAPAHQTLTQ
ncbi:hypothetical protein FRC12_011223 [Ceratobasidium sp. 428]|nr:hypothetical protein FRC12_011223 [Ceratobasidium sp. 428]